MTTRLAPLDLMTFDAILDYRDEHGYFATVRELAHELGMPVSNAHHRLCTLEELGVLERVPGHPRALRVLDGARP